MGNLAKRFTGKKAKAGLAFVLSFWITNAGLVLFGLATSPLNLFFFAAFLAFTFLIYHALQIINPKANLLSGLFGCVFSLLTVVGEGLRRTGRLELFMGSIRGFIGFLIILLAFAVAYFLVFHAIFYWVDASAALFNNREEKAPPDKSFFLRKLTQNKTGFLWVWAGTFLCWIPYWLSVFPGQVFTDSYGQMMIALGVQPPVNHHPMMHTFFIGIFVLVGKWFGSLSVAVVLYSIAQMLILSAIYAGVFIRLSKLEVAFWVRACIAGYFALFPVSAYYGFLMLKDCLFAGVFLLCIVETFLLCRNVDEFMQSRKKMVAYGVLLFFVATLRNNGVYVVLFFLPFFVFATRRYLKKALALTLAVVALLLLYTGPLFNLLGVTPGSKVEMMSVPLQQIARVAAMEKLSPGLVLSEEEKAVLQEFWPTVDVGEIYQPKISDPVKWSFNVEKYDEDKAGFYKFWFSLFLKNPVVYIESFLYGSLGYWYPDVPGEWIVSIGEINAGTFQDIVLPEGIEDVERVSYGLPVAAGLYWLTMIVPRNIPIVSLLYSIGMATWLCLLAFAILLYKRQTKVLYPFILLFMLWLTTIASPVYAEYRYLYGIIVAAPVCLAVALAAKKLPKVNKKDSVKRTTKTGKHTRKQ